MAFTEEEVRKKLKKLGLGTQNEIKYCEGGRYWGDARRYIYWRPSTYVDEGGFDANNYDEDDVTTQAEANDTENIDISGDFKVEDLEAVLWWARMHLGPRKAVKKRAPRKPSTKK